MKCFKCDTELIWENDWDAVDEYGYEKPGIVSVYHCPKCEAEYEVYDKFETEEICE